MYFNIDKVAEGCDKYVEIMDLCQKSDVTTNLEFQRKYKYFYKLRQKSKSFYENYFSLFERAKSLPNLKYKDVLLELYNKTGEVHYSFASKLLHTIDPNNPILDRFIMKWMGFELMGSDRKAEDRIKYYVDCYDRIAKEYEAAKCNFYIKSAIEEFDKKYPQYKQISVIKKIDSLLISKGTERMPSYLEYLDLVEKVKNLPGR